MIFLNKKFHPIIYVLTIGNLFMSIGFGLLVPFFSIYLSKYTNASLSYIGFLIGVSAIGSMIGGFIGGSISDIFGRKKIMILSLATSALIYTGFMFHSIPVLLIFLTVIHKFFLSFFDPCAKALIADFTEIDKRKEAFALRYTASNLGFAIGPVIGIILGVTSSSTLPFLICFVIFFSYVGVLYWVFKKYKINTDESLKEKATISGSIKVARKDKILILLLIGGLLSTTVHGQFSVILSQYFQSDFPQGLHFLMILWTVHAMVIISSSFPITKFMQKHSAFRSIVYGTILFTFGIIGFALSFNMVTFLVSMVIFTLGEVFLLPAEYAIIDEITPESLRGTYYGAVNFTSLGSFFGPWLAGYALENFSGKIMFSILGVISISSILFYYLGNKRKKLNINLKKFAV